MRRNRLKPLVWPVSLLVIGAVGGWLADVAVGRWQDYYLYGLTRPIADLLMIFSAIWLTVAVVGMIRKP